MKAKNKNRILFCAQNPGGFNAIWPVIKKIGKTAEILTVLSAEAKEIAAKEGIRFIDADTMKDDQLIETIEKFNPQIIMAGTSQGLSIDKKLIALAKKKKIPTISIMDFWVNYKMRFSGSGTDDLSFLPDFICVIDDQMKKQMIKEGFKADRLIITGNPFFDTFRDYSGIKGEYIVFAEQPFTELFSQKQKAAKASGLNEIEIFFDLIKTLEKQKVRYPVYIALHPRCKKADKFDKIIKNSALKIRIFKGDTKDLWKKAALIIGMNSMVLFQAALEGKKVLSYQSGLTKKEDPLMSNHLGLSCPAYSQKELNIMLRRILSEKKIGTNRAAVIKKYVNNSTQKVINLINKIK